MDASALRDWRQAHELSQGQLASMLDLPINTLARWERGEVAIRHPRILALALHALDLSLRVSAMQQDRRTKR
jgi:transcriptional regulator with XRE-family HTH domain